MHIWQWLKIGALAPAMCWLAVGQAVTTGLPPRATPTDYQAQAQAGKVTIAAEFKGHAVPTMESTLTDEDYVVVEVGFFGPPGSHLALKTNDFTLRINGKKNPQESTPYELVLSSLKDPEWEPPEKEEKKSKTSLGGGGNNQDGPPRPPKVPIEVQRAMAAKVKKASLPEGDRPLPVAGLLYFPHRGKTTGIKNVELIYQGEAGKVSFALQP